MEPSEIIKLQERIINLRIRAEDAEEACRELRERERVAIASWDEERKRGLREAARVSELRKDAHETAEVFCLVRQLMDGWAHDPSWSPHDEQVRRRISELQLKLDLFLTKSPA